MQTGNVNSANIPKNAYYASGEAHKKLSSTSDQIIKKTPITGARIVADKLVNSLFIYAPKGMQGSRNSNFYEFLSIKPVLVFNTILNTIYFSYWKFFQINFQIIFHICSKMWRNTS